MNKEYNYEKFVLKNNLELLKEIKELIEKLFIAESHLDDASIWFEDTPLRDILLRGLTLSYATYKNDKDFYFKLSETSPEDIYKKIIKEI